MSMRRKKGSREEQQQRRNKIMIAVFVSVLMLMSGAGLIADNLSGGNGSVREQYGISYIAQPNELGQQLQLVLEDDVYMFWFYPEDVSHIDYDPAIVKRITDASGVVFLFDPMSEQQDLVYLDMIRFDMGRLWTEKFEKQFGFGISQEDNTSVYAFPIVNCSDADAYNVVVQFIVDEEITGLTVNDNPNCIFAYGTEQEFLRTRDLIVYNYLGVI